VSHPIAPDITIWHIAASCVGSASVADPAIADDDELLEAVWAAAHQAELAGEWTGLRVSAQGTSPATVLYVEEAEVLIYADALREAVEVVREASSEHLWLPVTVEAAGSEHSYWLLHCTSADVALPNLAVDPVLALDHSVVHFAIGDNFPAFSDAARDAIAAACEDVVFDRANPEPGVID
jgi:hypothetical protein